MEKKKVGSWLCTHDQSPNKVEDNHTRLCFFFPAQALLLKYSGLFFAPLALVVVNDDSARCKKMAAMAIKGLLAQLDLNRQNTLFSLVNTWLNAEKVHSHTPRQRRWYKTEFKCAAFFLSVFSNICLILCDFQYLWRLWYAWKSYIILRKMSLKPLAVPRRPACGVSGLRSAVSLWRWRTRSLPVAWTPCCLCWRKR